MGIRLQLKYLFGVVACTSMLLPSCSDEGQARRRVGTESSEYRHGYVRSPIGSIGLLYKDYDKDYGLAEGDILIPKAKISPSDDGDLRAFGETSTWPHARVIYEFDPQLPEDVRARFYEAAHAWQLATGVQWVARSIERDYVYVRLDVSNSDYNGGNSGLGMEGGKQYLNLGKYIDVPTLKHELGHTMGLIHEHTRPDRDSYLIVSEEAKSDPQRKIVESKTALALGPFDYKSVMLYRTSYLANDTPDFLMLDRSEVPANLEISQGDSDGIKALYAIGHNARVSELRVRLFNAASGRCLEAVQDGNESFNVVLADCTGSAYQNFVLKNQSIGAANTRKCLDLWDNNHRDGTAISLYSCWESKNQGFVFDVAAKQLRHNDSGKCVGLKGNGAAPGTAIELQTCSGQPNQWFQP